MLERATGEELWRRECPRPRKEKLDGRNHPAAASAAADRDSVYVFFGDFGLLAYDLDGNERWRLPLGPFDNSYGMGASPIVVDELVVLVCDQRTDSFIVAVDKKTGRTRWRRPRPDAVSGHSTPVVYQTKDGAKQVLAPGSFRMDAYAASTGETVWWVNGLPSEMKSVPVIDGDTVYVAGYNIPANDAGRQVAVPLFARALAEYDDNGDGRLAWDELPKGRLRKLVGFSDRNRDGRLDAGEWRLYAAAQASENGLRAIRLDPPGRPRGDRTATSLRWKYPRAVPQLPSPLLYQGVLYMINDGGILTLLDPESGDVRRRMRLRGGIDHYYASPVAADGKVFFVSQGGAATVLRAGPKAEVLAVNELNEESYATPAIADGRLYVRMAGALYCFGKPTPERQWRVCSRKAAACGLTAHSGSAVICVAICVIPNFGCPKPPVCDSPTSLEHGWTASPGSRSTARTGSSCMLSKTTWTATRHGRWRRRPDASPCWRARGRVRKPRPGRP